jgi:hypothetical protein
MAFEAVTAAHRLAFKENVDLALQQKQSRVVDTFTYQSGMTGRNARMIQLIGTSEARRNPARGGETPDIPARVEDVWMAPECLDWGQTIEKEDTIKAVIDYKGYAVQTGTSAINRGRDNICVDAFFGPRRVGQDGLTVENWAGSTIAHDYVASGGAVASGLTLDKIIRGVSLMSAAEVEVETDPLFCLVNNVQMENLFRMAQLQSADFRKEHRLVLDEGMKMVIEFFGVRFIRYQRLSTVTGQPARRRVPLYAKSGMHYGAFDELETSIERNVQKRYRLHPYMELWAGATRSEDAKVVCIECNE